MDSIMDLYAPIQAVQAQNNAWSAEQAQKAMDYQTYMSNTAHQREVEDLKKAGLNPVLSAGGSGASTTSGIAAQAGNENVTALYGLMGKALQANIDQAKSMQNAAKYISDASTSALDSVSSLHKGETKDKNAVVGDGSVDFKSDLVDGIYTGVKDVLKRKFGVSNEAVDKVVDSLGIEKANASTVKNAVDSVLVPAMKVLDALDGVGVSNVGKVAIEKAKEIKEKSKGSTYSSSNSSSGRSGKFGKVSFAKA